MRVASYIRLSKEKQATSNAIANHLFQIKKAHIELGADHNHPLFQDLVGWVDRHWNVENIPRQELHSAGIFVDIQSGWRRSSDREDYSRILSLIKNREIDVLIVRQDRFSRDAELTIGLARTFEKSPVRLFELNKWRFIDFRDPDQWSEFCNSGVSNERESRVTSKRIKLQKEFNKSQGRLLGKPAYGFRRSPHGKPEIDPELREKALRMIEIFFECDRSCHVAVRVIREEIGHKWTPQGFHGWLMNPMLRGHTPYKTRDPHTGKVVGANEILPNTHEPLISPDQIRRIDERFVAQKGKHSGRKNYNFFALRPLLYCDRCGSPSQINVTTDSKYGYRYSNIYCRGHQDGSGCGGKIQGLGKKYDDKPNGRYNRLGTPYTLAEEQTIEALRLEALRLISEVAAEPLEEVTISPEEIRLERQIAKLEREVAEDPDLEIVLSKKRGDLRELRLRKVPDQQGEDSRLELAKLGQLASSSEVWVKLFEEMTLDEKASLLEKFVSSVYCDRDSVRVEFKWSARSTRA